MTYMLTTLHTVSLVQLQPRYIFSKISSFWSTHPDCLVHGSLLKSQSVIPKLFAISLKACAAKDIYDQIQPIKFGRLIFWWKILELHHHESWNYDSFRLNIIHLCADQLTFSIRQWINTGSESDRRCEAKEESWSKEKWNKKHLLLLHFAKENTCMRKAARKQGIEYNFGFWYESDKESRLQKRTTIIV